MLSTGAYVHAFNPDVDEDIDVSSIIVFLNSYKLLKFHINVVAAILGPNETRDWVACRHGCCSVAGKPRLPSPSLAKDA